MAQHQRSDDVAVNEANDLRRRLDIAGGLATARAESIAHLAALSAEARRLVADLHDAALSSRPIPQDQLRAGAARLQRLTETLSRTASGYTAVTARDMHYRNILEDLKRHGWIALPDGKLDGTLPPVSIRESGLSNGASVGYLRGWTRGPHELRLWSSCPSGLRYAWSSNVGRMFETREVSAIIRTKRRTRVSKSELPQGFRWPKDGTFGVTYLDVCTYLRHSGWIEVEADYTCDGNGRRRREGRFLGSSWTHSTDPDLRLYVWGAAKEHARLGYWAGPIVHFAQRGRITERYEQEGRSGRA